MYRKVIFKAKTHTDDRENTVIIIHESYLYNMTRLSLCNNSQVTKNQLRSTDIASTWLISLIGTAKVKFLSLLCFNKVIRSIKWNINCCADKKDESRGCCVGKPYEFCSEGYISHDYYFTQSCTNYIIICNERHSYVICKSINTF